MAKKVSVTFDEHVDEMREVLGNLDDEFRLQRALKIEMSRFANKSGLQDMAVTQEQAADTLLRRVQFHLSKGKYIQMAKLLWQDHVFNANPHFVKLMWDAFPNEVEVNILGSSSAGKSFSMAIWLLLDWIQDPEWTCIKVLSVSESHAKRNVFAHIKNMHRNSLIELPGIVREGSIQVGLNSKQGIHLMSVPTGTEGKGRLRGFHPEPRQKNHPKFGNVSRIRVILDEAEEIPEGIWEDVDNVLGSRDGTEIVKVFSATNPKNRASKLGQRCEPSGGWGTVNVNDSETWIAKNGSKVIRLDGIKGENVISKKVIYPGMLTYEGFQNYLSQGEDSATFSTMARGWFPEKGTSFSIWTPELVSRCKGQFIFNDDVTYCASVDLALEGGDKIPMTIGRFGFAHGYSDQTGAVVKFDKMRMVLQVDQQFLLDSGDTFKIVNQVKDTCRAMGIKHHFLAVDSTGLGAPIADVMKQMIGPEIVCINYGTEATDLQICAEDTQKANELYSGLVTELWFAARRWAEFHYLKISTMFSWGNMERDMTQRKYRLVTKGRSRVESKKEYKQRTAGRSPDEVDSLFQLVHLVRMRSEHMTEMVPDRVREDPFEKPILTLEDCLNKNFI